MDEPSLPSTCTPGFPIYMPLPRDNLELEFETLQYLQDLVHLKRAAMPVSSKNDATQ